MRCMTMATPRAARTTTLQERPHAQPGHFAAHLLDIAEPPHCLRARGLGRHPFRDQVARAHFNVELDLRADVVGTLAGVFPHEITFSTAATKARQTDDS